MDKPITPIHYLRLAACAFHKEDVEIKEMVFPGYFVIDLLEGYKQDTLKRLNGANCKEIFDELKAQRNATAEGGICINEDAFFKKCRLAYGYFLRAKDTAEKIKYKAMLDAFIELLPNHLKSKFDEEMEKVEM